MYTEPEWGQPTSKPGYFEVLKEGRIIESIPVSVGTRYISFGRLPENNLKLDHDSISRKHAILQFGPRNSAFIYDLGSTHGTFLSKKRLPAGQYVKITCGNDMIQFGASKRLYLLHLEETLLEEPSTGLKTGTIYGKSVISFLKSRGISLKSIEFLQKGNIISCTLDFSDFVSIDHSEPLSITSSGATKEEALENLSRGQIVLRKMGFERFDWSISFAF